MANIIVTGGSRGVGLAIVKVLAAAGHDVIAVARGESDDLGIAKEEALAAGKGSVRFRPFDFGDIDNIAGLVRTLRRDHGSIHGLVNNAALGTEGALAIMHNSQIEALIRVNTLAPIVLTKYVVRSMLADGGGRIVNVASIVGFTGYSGLSAYAATKAAMIGFTRSLAREVGGMKINVNAVAPGFMDTAMTQSLGEEDRAKVAHRSALRRLPEVGDVADAVEFLLSDKARNITGTVMTVDAGSTA